METTSLGFRDNGKWKLLFRFSCFFVFFTGPFRLGITEKKMETTILGLGFRDNGEANRNYYLRFRDNGKEI